MADHSLELRRGIITALKADSGVAALVGARVYEEPPAKVTFPFIRYGFPIVTDFRPDGWTGGNYDLTVHAFSVVNTDEVESIAKAIQLALDEVDVPIDGDGGVLSLVWRTKNIIRDTDEASAYHAIVGLSAITAEIVG